tara:strand:+ start:19108 stop:20031 length:924 start_codon:yes stop_codon:yes gene_type:complete
MAKLCKSKKVVNSKVNPKRWFYGLEHCREVQYSALPLGETIIPLNHIKEDYTEVLGYIHVTNGGADPAPVGLTKLATVDAAAAADVAALLADIKTQLEASLFADYFQIQVSTTGVEIFNNFIGLISVEDDTAEASLTIAIGQQSFGGAIGILSEDGASAAFEFEFLDQLGDATGNVAIEKWLIGLVSTITMSITDTSREKFEELFIKPLGGIYENGADKLIGFGTANFFQSLMTKIGKLVGHDSAAAFTDRSNDWQMLAVPNPSSINFNKELQVIEVEFTSAFDATMPEAINIFSIGDKTKIDFASL